MCTWLAPPGGTNISPFVWPSRLQVSAEMVSVPSFTRANSVLLV
jgi:hypothetical protein